MKKYFYEFEAHDRHITICLLVVTKIGGIEIYGGMSICCPLDQKKVDLGRQIAEGRAVTRKEGRSSTSSKGKYIGNFSGAECIYEDKHFINQIARSYFFDFKHNPEKYIASFNRTLAGINETTTS